MAEAEPVQFPGNYLDPSAKEFWPAQNAVFQPQIPLFMPSELYYTYAAAPSLTMSFSGGGVAQLHVGVPVPVPAPCVTGSVTVSLLPPLPPPSAAATRALVLTSTPCDVSESRVREELEVFGEVRMVQMERVGEGIVTVHFYDLRHAERALREIRNQHMQQQKQQSIAGAAGHKPGESDACTPLPRPERGRILGITVWAHFIIPVSNALPDGNNQGTVVVFNLDPGVSNSELRDIFQAYGPVKELRETPLKKHQKFVEFYDVRDAAEALREMNGKEINGKQIVIEFSRPGGYNRKFFNANTATNITPFKAYTRNISLTPGKYNHPPLSPPIAPRFSNRYSPNTPRSFLSRSLSPTEKVTESTKGNPNDSYKSRSSAGTTVISGGAAAKKTAKKSQSNQSTQRISNGGKQLFRGKPWKGKQERKFDPRFLITEEAMAESNCQDSRTTVMIKNIPNKYSQKLLLNMLDNHCIHCNEQIVNDGDDRPLSSYDFVYLPIDFNNKCNVGYGFVNMTSPQATWRLYKAFHHQHWEVFNSRKICEVTYARVQGLQALKEHFRNSKFPCEMDHYLPVVFSPPRDGKLLNEPVPVVGEKQQPRSINNGPSPELDDEQSDSVDENSSDDNLHDGCGGGENNNAAITGHFNGGDVGSDTLK
ncbi:Terminal EAR1-like 1, putative isoform 2 [Hibiscus syriacus]|uniref:Terminal EAR1-like 1, putative isoform 2 n=1 Tax=Hibiscus syriacus TaxID=106335 RepID=A0A6A2WRZ8_HIBSY|nr:protein terminal ear1 homolog [Hibiscus syriacus]KAE8663863.1 Terminal EAR1-like 1, putative isoform 2 [Hibiscus syriacus]